MIEITGVNLIDFAKKAYELSSPQGLGMLHFTPAPLRESDAKECLIPVPDGKDGCVLSMDYIHGRACKMDVKREKGKLFIRDQWYDHTDDQLKRLLAAFKIEMKGTHAHSPACNCFNCREKVPS